MYSDYPYYIPTIPSQSVVTESVQENDDFYILLEQSETDIANIKEGIKVTDVYFNPNLSEKNIDGTYKRIVYNQIKNSFYGYDDCKDFTKLFGLDNIDLILDGKNRIVYDKLKTVSIPQIYYGDKIVENTVCITENEGEQSYTIVDDGNGNLVTRDKVFSIVTNDNKSNLVSYHSSSIIDINSSGMLVDSIERNDINWIYLTPQYLFFRKEDVKNFKVSHDYLSETPPVMYESNLCYVGMPYKNQTYNLNNIPSSSYTISSSLLGVFNKIECGGNFVMVLDERNCVNCWGDGVKNLYGEDYHVISTYKDGLKDVSVGDTHAVFLDSNGKVYLWEGSDTSISASFSSNEIFNGVYSSVNSGPNGSLLTRTNGGIVGFGTSDIFSEENIPTGYNVKKIAVGLNHAMLLTVDGDVIVWGNNDYNQLEVPSLISKNAIDISCGDNHNVVLLKDSRVVSWGDNSDRQSFVPFGTTINDWGSNFSTNQSIVATVGLSNIMTIQAKHNNTCIIKSKICNCNSTRYGDDDYTMIWGTLSIISKYSILQCGIGLDYAIFELNNPYQQVMYLPNYKYPTHPKLIYDDGISSYTSSILLLKEGEYNSYNAYVSSPMMNYYSGEDGFGNIVFSYEQISQFNTEIRNYITISHDMLVKKLNLSNSQNSKFYVKYFTYDYIVGEGSAYRIDCGNKNSIYYLVEEMDYIGNYNGTGSLTGSGWFNGTGSFYGTGSFTGKVDIFSLTNVDVYGRYDGTGSFYGTGSFAGTGSFIGTGSFSPSLQPQYFVLQDTTNIYLAYEGIQSVFYFADSINNLLYLETEPVDDYYEIEHTFSDNLNRIESQLNIVNVPIETFDDRQYMTSYIIDSVVPIYFFEEEKQKIFITEFISKIIDYE